MDRMRPIDSAYDNAMAAWTVTPTTLHPDMVYWLDPVEERVLVWRSADDALDDDGSQALYTDFGDMTYEEIVELLRSSDMEEV